MALPTLDSVFASAADQPRKYMLAQWLVNELGSGAIADYVTFPERYLWAKIAVAAGAPLPEANYISLPKQYVWKAIYDAVSGSSLGTIDWSEKQALGHIAAAYRGDTGTPANLATYINWPWRYQVASIIIYTSTDSDVLAFIAASGATDIEGLDAFVKGVKNLGLWESMVAWPLRSSQNAGTGTTAYSLGGLGTYNGTLVNNPTWENDGIDCASSGQKINFGAASNLNSYGEFAIFGVQKYASLDAGGKVVLWSRQDGSWPLATTINVSTGGGTHRINTSDTRYVSATRGSFDVGQWHSYIATLDGAETGFVTYNKTNPTAFGAASTNGAAPNGNWVLNENDAKGTYAIHAVFHKHIHDKREELYDLYKSTIGTGLSLP